MGLAAELLTNLSTEELEALADCQLAPSPQERLSELLDRYHQKLISAEENSELHRLLQQADQLMLLKARARYTLSQVHAGVAEA